jgi:carbonic anhydrase/acetyltransferase-like protein (isoleucine patch superfamily)
MSTAREAFMIYQFEDWKPQVHPTVYIAPGCHIIGDVILEEYSSVWFNSTLRADLSHIKVGRHVNLQENCVIHVERGLPTELGDYVLVGHSVIIHASKVGAGSMIGMGSILLDGCVVGENTIIGAGSLVKMKDKIPAGVLALGSPARVIRELKQEEMDWIKKSSQSYSERAQMYKKGLKPL